MEILKNKTCCFTGHRPEKTDISQEKILILTKNAIEKSIEDGYEIFISGMSKGFDLLAANIILEMKKELSKIKLICAIPYQGFEKYFKNEEKIIYNRIIENSDEIYFICNHYSRFCFQIRNSWMIDNSDRVISFYCGKKGGTENTLKYAKSKSIKIVNIFD